ncbi:MAG: hypothetical protein GTO14_04080 [Anaerolineales bacterium]|nr:hypothetical protein [Anaerolineales bacterium]
MSTDKVKILFIAGWGRSGSTIVGNILSQCKGLFHVGELWYLWERGIQENRLCGCNERFSNCQVWQSILHRHRKKGNLIPSSKMIALHRKFARTRNLPKMLLYRHGESADSEFPVYTNEIASLFHNIVEATGEEIIVDSSKIPSYGYILSRIPSLSVSILHLIRDPRGTGYSWRKQKFDPAQERYMVKNSLVKNSVLWTVWNFSIEKLWRDQANSNYMQVRYEDFASQPRQIIERILRFIDIEDSLDFFKGSSEITLRSHHTVSGNPVRTKTGTITIQPDLEWKRKLGIFEILLTSALTAPLLHRYGYPILPRPGVKDPIKPE